MAYKLDLKDKKLLYELDLNSRRSVNEIAKKISLSKTATANRIDSLQKEGIIKQFHTVIDTGKIGYIPFRLLIHLQNTSPQKELEIIDFLKNQNNVTWIVSIEGEYDLGALILTKSIEEMNKLWEDINKKYVNHIDKKLLTIMTCVHYFSRAYLIKREKNEYEILTLTPPTTPKIDKKDLEILQLLAHNARMLIIDIASKINLTPKTVIEKIKRLEKEKIIVGYKTVFNLEKMGYQYYKVHFMLNNLTFEKMVNFKAYLKQNPNVIYEDEVLGGDDIEIEIQINNSQELRGIIDEIRLKFSDIIKDYKILEYYKERKYLFFPI